MEIEDEQAIGTAAQQQLQTFAESSRTAQLASLQISPRWLFPGLAFVGPAAIWLVTAFGGMAEVGTTEQLFLAVGGIAMMVPAIAAGIMGIKWQFTNSPVHPKVPGAGGPSSKWAVLTAVVPVAIFVIVTQLVVVFDVYAPYVIGGLLYVALAILPAYFWRQNVETVAARLR